MYRNIFKSWSRNIDWTCHIPESSWPYRAHRHHQDKSLGNSFNPCVTLVFVFSLLLVGKVRCPQRGSVEHFTVKIFSLLKFCGHVFSGWKIMVWAWSRDKTGAAHHLP